MQQTHQKKNVYRPSSSESMRTSWTIEYIPLEFPCDLSHWMISSVENVPDDPRNCRHFRGRANFSRTILWSLWATVWMRPFVPFSLNLISLDFRRLWLDWLCCRRPHFPVSDWMWCVDVSVVKVYCLWHCQSPPYLSWSMLMNSIVIRRPYPHANSLVVMDHVFHPAENWNLQNSRN